MAEQAPNVARVILLLAAVQAKLSRDQSLILSFKCYLTLQPDALQGVETYIQLVAPDGSPVMIRGTLEAAPEQNRSAGWHAYRFNTDRANIASLFLWQYPNASNMEFVYLEHGDTKREIQNRNYKDPKDLVT